MLSDLVTVVGDSAAQAETERSSINRYVSKSAQKPNKAISMAIEKHKKAGPSKNRKNQPRKR